MAGFKLQRFLHSIQEYENCGGATCWLTYLGCDLAQRTVPSLEAVRRGLRSLMVATFSKSDIAVYLKWFEKDVPHSQVTSPLYIAKAMREM